MVRDDCKQMKRYNNIAVEMTDVRAVTLNPPMLMLGNGVVMHIDSDSAGELLNAVQSASMDSTAEMPAISVTVKQAATEPSSL